MTESEKQSSIHILSARLAGLNDELGEAFRQNADFSAKRELLFKIREIEWELVVLQQNVDENEKQTDL